MSNLRRPMVRAGGGFLAIRYTWKKAREVGFFRLFKAMRSKNACKTCALGMGGQKGGMVNELGHFPEFCKKSLQAMAADMQGGIAPQFFEKFDVKALRAMSPRELETAGRLTEPLFLPRGGSHYQKVSWEWASSKVATKLGALSPDEVFFYLSGRSSNEAAFLLQLFARQFGTNHVSNCSYYCHQASGVGLKGSIGTGTATVSAEDLERADFFMLIGGNPASNHPRLMTQLMRLRRRGGRVVVVNPVRETGLERFRIPSDPRSLLFGTEIASDYVQVAVGGDIGLLMGLCKALLEKAERNPEVVNADFIAAHTEDFQAVKDQLKHTRWEDIVAHSGVDRATMEQVADHYGKAKGAIFGWTMGITHHVHGVDAVQWIVNLALLRGMVGRPGAGLMPIRGHSNVQGIGSVGVTPALSEAIAERFLAHGLKVPKQPGLDTMATMEAMSRGQFKFGLALGGNLFGSNPDANFARDAMNQLELMVYLNTSLNTGHAHGTGQETLILPVLARDEEPYKTTQESMFNYVRLSDGGSPRHVGPRAELQIISELAGRIFKVSGPIIWSHMGDAEAVRAWIAKLVPGLAPLETIGKTAEEFVIDGRVMQKPKFPTASGKARFHGHPMPERDGNVANGKAKDQSLMLMTVRSEGQFNTVVYEEEDLYRGQERRDVVLLNREDMQRLGLVEDQPVRVESSVGSLGPVLARSFEIKAGGALMYYPEANVLVPRRIDPKAKTPAFKSVPVVIVPLGLASNAGVRPHGNGRATAALSSSSTSSSTLTLRKAVQSAWNRWRHRRANAC